MNMKSKELAFCGAALVFAVICGYLEFLLSLSIIIFLPGIKLGLANVVILVLLYLKNARIALLINVARVVLCAILFGGLFSLIYSFCGALLSFAVMILLKKSNLFGLIGISAAGGAAHNFAQILAASIIIKNAKMFYYLPLLIIFGIITGIITGFLAGIIIKRVNNI